MDNDMNKHAGSSKLIVAVSIFGISLLLFFPTSCAADYVTTTETFQLAGGAGAASYLLMTPSGASTGGTHPLIVYLYGRGGSIQPGQYNLADSSYNQFRQLASSQGYDIIVPELGTDDWMNNQAEQTLDAIIADAGAKNPINLNAVNVMGMSMGGGSALAYTIHRPDLIKAVCSLSGMSDFAQWVQENPTYLSSVSTAYGGSPSQVPAAWAKTSAMENLGAFTNIPVYLVHGSADTTVPPSQSIQLYDALTNLGDNVTLQLAQGLGHVDGVVTPYSANIVDFFNSADSVSAPEPSTWALLVMGLLCLLAYARRKRK